MKVVAIVQARLGSQRLPNKVLQDVEGASVIAHVLSRLSLAREIDAIVLATSELPINDPLDLHVRALGYSTFRGSEGDVLDRYYKAALEAGAEAIVRITGDCPLIDPHIVDNVVRVFRSGVADYVSNVDPPTFPDGLDVEVFSFSALSIAWRECEDQAEREHVTPFIRRSGQFRRSAVANDQDCSVHRWTVDEASDLDVVREIYSNFSPRTEFGWKEVLALVERSPDRFNANRQLKRNAGSEMGTGEKLWVRAKRVIPGGNMLLSKRSEMFLPDRWPAYFSRAKGCTVWDLDGKPYIDMSLMGVGTNTLGYGHDEVDEVVREVVNHGNLSTLNCPEEVLLAERLVAMHPWSDMVRLCRTGGEVNAVAVRVARAASGRDKVAFCGYHGWHDWYLAANLGDSGTLAGHLLPGLEPNGVPKHLSGSIRPFSYNSIGEFDAAVSDPDVGVIFMEVSRNRGPDPGFLEHVRRIATERGLVLIFDECTSGFRETFGGLHKLYGVDPDMATFGKTLGNGYAITAVIGRRAIMEAAQTSFISSSFWTERIGPAAALKTLEVMERERSWERITEIGNSIRSKWQDLADAEGIKIEHWGLPSLCGFTVKSDSAAIYKTLITQEMLGKGYLAAHSVYSCLAHTNEVIDAFFEQLAPVFCEIGACEKEGRDASTLLSGPVAHAGFKRLN